MTGPQVRKKDHTRGYLPSRTSRSEAATKAEAKASVDATEYLILVVSEVPQNRKGNNFPSTCGTNGRGSCPGTPRGHRRRRWPSRRKGQRPRLYHASIPDLSCWENEKRLHPRTGPLCTHGPQMDVSCPHPLICNPSLEEGASSQRSGWQVPMGGGVCRVRV